VTSADRADRRLAVPRSRYGSADSPSGIGRQLSGYLAGGRQPEDWCNDRQTWLERSRRAGAALLGVGRLRTASRPSRNADVLDAAAARSLGHPAHVGAPTFLLREAPTSGSGEAHGGGRPRRSAAQDLRRPRGRRRHSRVGLTRLVRALARRRAGRPAMAARSQQGAGCAGRVVHGGRPFGCVAQVVRTCARQVPRVRLSLPQGARGPGTGGGAAISAAHDRPRPAHAPHRHETDRDQPGGRPCGHAARHVGSRLKSVRVVLADQQQQDWCGIVDLGTPVALAARNIGLPLGFLLGSPAEASTPRKISSVAAAVRVSNGRSRQ